MLKIRMTTEIEMDFEVPEGWDQDPRLVQFFETYVLMSLPDCVDSAAVRDAALVSGDTQEIKAGGNEASREDVEAMIATVQKFEPIGAAVSPIQVIKLS